MPPEQPAFRAAYRLQLTPEFGFAAARELVPYLRELGVSHLYLSPSLEAREGSQHGYDVVDPRHVSAALGGEDELRRLAAEGLGVILDIVPNHMAAVDESPFWRDPSLREMFFDVDLRTGFHRRFFDVGELGGIKQEDWEVFWATHAKVVELVRDGVVDGVRVDHPDGLADPAAYFERLADAGIAHVWAEKILEPGEELRDWPVEGTTGYEFLNDVMALCVNREAETLFSELYESVTGDTRRFDDIAALAKLEVAVNIFEPELRRLHQEVEVENLPLALASFQVYRTYIEPITGVVGELDRDEIGRANVSENLRRLLLLEEPGSRGVRRPLPADDRAGDGEGCRGHRVLPLLPTRRAQRGRRQPGTIRDQRRRVPRSKHEACGKVPAAAADDLHTRHEARSGCAFTHRGTHVAR